MLVSVAYSYQYNDFTWEHDYRSPNPVNDNLVDNCYNLEIDYSICDTINRNDNLTIEQKKSLILDGINPSASYPDYDFIESWNSNIQFTKYNKNYSNSGAIKNAWVKLLYLNPAVFLENKTLLNRTGKIYSEFAFSFVVPKREFRDDCKTEYDIRGYDYWLDILLNGDKINSGNEKQTEFILNQTNNTFETRLNVESQYVIKHYKWKQRCGRSTRGITICYSICEIDSIDDYHDRLSISDNEEAYLYNFSHDKKSIVDDNYNDLLDYWFSYNVSNDFTGILFRSNNSSISETGVDYKLKYDHEPYNIIIYEATKKQDKVKFYGVSILEDNKTEDNNSVYRKIHALVPYSDNCTLRFISHFDKFLYSDFCRVTEEKPELNISIFNRTNETIEFEILFFENTTNMPLENKDLIIYYGGLEKTAITDLQGKTIVDFPLSKENSMVKAKFITDLETKSAEKIFIVPPKEPDILNWLFYVVSLILVLYLFHKLSRRLMFNAN